NIKITSIFAAETHTGYSFGGHVNFLVQFPFGRVPCGATTAIDRHPNASGFVNAESVRNHAARHLRNRPTVMHRSVCSHIVHDEMWTCTISVIDHFLTG